MNKLIIRQAIVVEGRCDINALKRVADAMIIETSGFRIFSDKEKLALLRRLANDRGLIILTDSDSAGFVIRNHLRGALPKDGVTHAYIPSVKGKERRKRTPSKEGLLGVEGMEDAVIAEALERAGASFVPAGTVGNITKADLYGDGFSGRSNSAKRRAALLASANLPSGMGVNAMLEALNLFYDRDGYNQLVKSLDS